MSLQRNSWQEWEDVFRARSGRELPKLEVDIDYSRFPASLAHSLAIFQLGESGGGTIVQQTRMSTLPHIDEHYGNAMSLFVAEENRHANLLGLCVRLLKGRLIRNNWTARLFVFGRRLIGLRLKVMVLLAAEVVGLCYYHLLASRLPPCRLRETLADIVEDERTHLYFHCDFLRSQVTTAWHRRIFIAVWRSLMLAAAVVVMIDHRAAIRDLDIGRRNVFDRWMSFSRLAETLVVSDSPSHCAEQTVRTFSGC